ncbi:MAG: gloB [Agromyces sp.]|jgi:glyoxylase-like metal-dependent hydrolase (beta-lactamase superfamily II)|nr:gloB [Agromyces sp.]
MTTKIHPIAAPWGRFHLYSFLIDAPELAIVDTGVAESAAGVPRALEAFGRRIEDVRWILLTHGHIDHVGGAFAIWEATGRRAQVVIGERDAPFLRSRRAHVEEFLELRGEYVPGAEAEERKTADAAASISGEMEPTLLVQGGETLDLGGVSVSVHAVPGHTPGAVAYVVDGQDDVFVGDSVQCYGAASGFPGYEDAVGYRQSLEYLRDVVKPQHLYLGHPYRRADGTPFPVGLDEADASEAIQGSIDNEARIRAAVERCLADGLVVTDSPYSPFEAVAEELGYTGDPTHEPAPFFTTMHAYRMTFPPGSGRTKGARHG